MNRRPCVDAAARRGTRPRAALPVRRARATHRTRGTAATGRDAAALKLRASAAPQPATTLAQDRGPATRATRRRQAAGAYAPLHGASRLCGRTGGGAAGRCQQRRRRRRGRAEIACELLPLVGHRGRIFAGAAAAADRHRDGGAPRGRRSLRRGRRGAWRWATQPTERGRRRKRGRRGAMRAPAPRASLPQAHCGGGGVRPRQQRRRRCAAPGWRASTSLRGDPRGGGQTTTTRDSSSSSSRWWWW